MTDYNRVDSSNLDAFLASTGTLVPAAGGKSAAAAGAQPAAFGVTLVATTTYYIPFGAPKSPMPAETSLETLHLRWDNAIVATITIEDSNFPATTSPGDSRGAVDVSDFDITAGNWIPENPSTAIVSVVGGSAVAATVTVPGGSAGGCIFHIGNLGSRRGRAKIVVGGTGGKIRAAVHGKAGG